ncbi:MAG: phosphoribosylglycinamide synthetase C domain-containing protein, partial [Bacteriovoracaceae bacterium]
GYVVKADGLAAGKGVMVCHDRKSAMAALKKLMVDNSLNLDSANVIIEEKLIGKELSLFALFDENTYLPLGSACDYKRIRDNDQGPNTGGMGTYSPVDWLEESELQKLNDCVFPALHQQLKAMNAPYQGVVFAGIMQTAAGPKVLEFNVRFGDPETQSLLPRIQNDFFNLLDLCANNRLQEVSKVALSPDSVAHVALAAQGYPGTEGEAVAKGDEIKIDLPLSGRSHWVTFAGTNLEEGKLKTCGGRVLGISAMGPNRKEARAAVYDKIKFINFKGAQYRNDIGK